MPDNKYFLFNPQGFALACGHIKTRFAETKPSTNLVGYENLL